MVGTNWFDCGGADYAHFRPRYPRALAKVLVDCAPRRRLALDVGCGSGQLTTLIAPGFDQTLGLDPSASQLASVDRSARVGWVCSRAERLPLRPGRVDLVTVAQAAHWFDLSAFYAEVRRVSAPGAVLALIAYGVLHLDGAGVDRCFQRFYTDEIGPWWPLQRRLVDTGYRTLDFPFAERAVPPMQMQARWTLPAFLGYLSTWSAVRRAREAGRGEVLAAFADRCAALWGTPRQARVVTWPLYVRLGEVA